MLPELADHLDKVVKPLGESAGDDYVGSVVRQSRVPPTNKL
jgi:hypothetical protein